MHLLDYLQRTAKKTIKHKKLEILMSRSVALSHVHLNICKKNYSIVYQISLELASNKPLLMKLFWMEYVLELIIELIGDVHM